METSIGRNEATFPTPGIFFEGDKGEGEREREKRVAQQAPSAI